MPVSTILTATDRKDVDAGLRRMTKGRAKPAMRRSIRPSVLEPRQFGEAHLPAVDMHAIELGAAAELREHLAGVQQSIRVERAFQPLLLLHVGLGEHGRHQVALFDPDPVLPGQDITTRIWEVGTADGVTTYGFEATNPDGDVVIKDGLAEVAAD